jgi:NitT/TauT family transport system substrate-binding protein
MPDSTDGRAVLSTRRNPTEGVLMTMERRRPPRGRLAVVAVLLAATVVCFGGVAAGAPAQSLTTVTLTTIPIANGFPLDLGIQKGFFAKQGIEIKKVFGQSGNDIVLKMANNNTDIGYIGYVPAILARTQGIPITVVSASETEGTSEADNWQNIVVDGSSPIRTPADLVGKTLALNALKGVGEVTVKAALDKRGVDPNSVKYLPIPFPTMPTALANGQVDAIWTPEPGMSAVLARGGRIVMAPGPVLGKYFPNGCYCAREDWVRKNPGVLKRFRAAMSESLIYANSHPDEIRALLPAATRNIRLPTWSPLIDRVQLLELALYMKKYDVISTLPNMTKLVPSFVEGGRTLQATVGESGFITLRLDGKLVSKLRSGNFTVAVSDKASKDNFHLQGAGVDRSTSVPKKQTATWILELNKGVYRYSSDGSSKRKGSFRVT